LALGHDLIGPGLDCAYLFLETGLPGDGLGPGLGQGLFKFILDPGALLNSFVGPSPLLGKGLLSIGLDGSYLLLIAALPGSSLRSGLGQCLFKFVLGPGDSIDSFISPRPLFGQGLISIGLDLNDCLFSGGLGLGHDLIGPGFDCAYLFLKTGLPGDGLGLGLGQGPLEFVLDPGAMVDSAISPGSLLGKGLLSVELDLSDFKLISNPSGLPGSFLGPGPLFGKCLYAIGFDLSNFKFVPDFGALLDCVCNPDPFVGKGLLSVGLDGGYLSLVAGLLGCGLGLGLRQGLFKFLLEPGTLLDSIIGPGPFFGKGLLSIGLDRGYLLTVVGLPGRGLGLGQC